MKDFEPLINEDDFPKTIKTKRIFKEGEKHFIDGYALEDDLQQHYDFVELLYFMATQNFPNKREKILFEKALILMMPKGMNHPATFSMRTAFEIKTKTSSLLSIGAIGLSEEANEIYDESETLRQAIQNKDKKEIEKILKEKKKMDLKNIFESLKEKGIDDLNDDLNFDLKSLPIYLLEESGISEKWQYLLFFVLSGLAASFSEAQSHEIKSLNKSSFCVPRFEYVEK